MQQVVEGVMTSKKGSRMGGLGKLSDFGKTLSPQPEPKPEQVASSEVEKQQPVPTEKLVPINIKITRAQQRWLADTARMVRDNNDTPVAPTERVFPQHLIGVAIDLLRDTEIDWSNVRNIEDLRQQLKL